MPLKYREKVSRQGSGQRVETTYVFVSSWSLWQQNNLVPENRLKGRSVSSLSQEQE